QARARRPAFLRSGLRPEPDREVGRKAKTPQHGHGRSDGPKGARLVIQPVLQHEALLIDIQRAREDRDHFHLWWLGQSGFLLQWHDHHLLFDPYLSDSLTRKYACTDKPHVRMTELVIDPERIHFVDVVTSSHNHTDH